MTGSFGLLRHEQVLRDKEEIRMLKASTSPRSPEFSEGITEGTVAACEDSCICPWLDLLQLRPRVLSRKCEGRNIRYSHRYLCRMSSYDEIRSTCDRHGKVHQRDFLPETESPR